MYKNEMLSENFNENVFNKIKKIEKRYLYLYPFLYGLLISTFIFVIILSVYQIPNIYYVFLAALSMAVIIYSISRFKILWRKVNLF